MPVSCVNIFQWSSCGEKPSFLPRVFQGGPWLSLLTTSNSREACPGRKPLRSFSNVRMVSESLRKLSEAHGTTLSSMRTADFNGREKERDSVGTSSGCENEFNSHENINRKEGFSRHRPRTLTTRKIFKPETSTFKKVKVFERRGTSRDYCSMVS